MLAVWKMRDLEIEIVKFMFEAKRPLTGYEIAKGLKANLSSVYNVLKKFEKLGITRSSEDKPKQYVLQSFYYYPGFWNLFINQLKPVMRVMFKEGKIKNNVPYHIYIIASLLKYPA